MPAKVLGMDTHLAAFLIVERQVYAAEPAPQTHGGRSNMPATISLEECRALAFEAFSNVGVCRAQAEETADHITRAEADGCKSHGLFRLPGFIASVPQRQRGP